MTRALGPIKFLKWVVICECGALWGVLVQRWKLYIGEKKRKEQSKHNCKMIYEWSGAIPLHYMSAPFHKGRKLGFPSWPPCPSLNWIHILCFVLYCPFTYIAAKQPHLTSPQLKLGIWFISPEWATYVTHTSPSLYTKSHTLRM